LHSGVAIDLLALGARAGSRQIKRHSERRRRKRRGQSQAATSPNSCTVQWGGSRNWALCKGRGSGFRVGLETKTDSGKTRHRVRNYRLGMGKDTTVDLMLVSCFQMQVPSSYFLPHMTVHPAARVF